LSAVAEWPKRVRFVCTNLWQPSGPRCVYSLNRVIAAALGSVPPHPTTPQPMIQMLREQRSIARRQLCHMLGMTRSVLAAIEGGHAQPSPKLLARIAEALKVPIHELLYPY
jgi:DNA-binding XRE family transcriptional regulator